MVFELSDDIVFPDPRLGEKDGLLAIGGDLSEDRLLLAYSYGIFPWFSFRDWPYPAWYCPMKRFVIFPDEVHVSHSMHTLMNRGVYRVSFNEDFDGVIKGCSEVNGRYYQNGAWLGEDIINAYTHMHQKGYAKSVEVWNQEGNWRVACMALRWGTVLSARACSLASPTHLNWLLFTWPGLCKASVAK